jgi:DNA polymerase I-like protein with 3'-5' exonuclease and polymerase domains
MKVSENPKCSGCPIAAKNPQAEFIPPQLGPSLRLVVGSAPYVNKDAKTLNILGSDKMFASLASKAGIKKESLSVVQCFNCVQPDNIVSVGSVEAQQHCWRNHTKPVLDSRPWERIDALGSVALRALTGKTDGILKWRGSPLPVLGETKPRVLPTVLPIAESKHEPSLMRDYTLIPAFISDLKKGLITPPEHYDLSPEIDSLNKFLNAETLCFDIETNMFTKSITMVGLSVTPYHVTVVPFRGGYIGALKRIFASARNLVGQNCVAFDIPTLEHYDIKMNPEAQVWDIMLMQHLLQPDLPHDLEFISSLFTQKPAWKHLSEDNKALYCARDVDVTLMAFKQLKPYCDVQKLTDLYKYVQIPLAKICKLMTDYGIKQDFNKIKELRDKYVDELAVAVSKLPKDLQPFDKSINIRIPAPAGTLGKSGKPVKFISQPSVERVVPYNSPKAVGKYLYTTLGLPEQLHPKTKQVTTDKNAIERLWRKTRNPEIKALNEVSRIETLLTSFLKDESSDIKVQRVHSNFLPHGTATGRLSSSNPNMQNNPPVTKFTFVPTHADWCFVEVDYSSLENRLSAWYANDSERLTRLSTPGFNEHKWLAGHIFNIPMNEVDKSSYEYGIGKHSNHGADAGMGPSKMAKQYDLIEKDCRNYLDMWKKLNHKSAEWQVRTGNQAGTEGVLTTAFGRKRWFWSFSSYTDGIRFMTQGTGADVCYRAMISLMYERINWPAELAMKVVLELHPLPMPAQLVLQIHDSLLFEMPKSMVESTCQVIKQAAEQYWPELGGMNIPVAFKVGEPGQSWGELKEVKV